ncbi:MAG TPA: PilZ domain-containing protein [Terriglobales bacterium]|jgi:hypothetical protein|nr:PilZ domain-containing protein [Terriglobales bacterium]
MPTDCVPIPQLEGSARRDSRKTDRIAVRREVQLRTSDQRILTALCTDVNLSGIGIDTERVLKVGQRLEIELKLKNGDTARVPLMVIYRMGKHYGLSTLTSAYDLLELLPINS